MRISKLADYAIVIMSHLVKYPGQVQSAAVVAEATHLNLPTVSKLLKILAEAELVTSIRGAEGGYQLARPAVQINLAEIIAAIEGNMALTMCCEAVNLCALNATCTLKNNWKKINSMIDGLLSQFTLQDMTQPLKLTGLPYVK